MVKSLSKMMRKGPSTKIRAYLAYARLLQFSTAIKTLHRTLTRLQIRLQVQKLKIYRTLMEAAEVVSKRGLLHNKCTFKIVSKSIQFAL